MNKKSICLLGKDFNSKLVGRVVYSPNKTDKTITVYTIDGMYKNPTKVVIGLKKDNPNNIEQRIVNFESQSGLYLNRKDAQKELDLISIQSKTQLILNLNNSITKRNVEINNIQAKINLEQSQIETLELEVQNLEKHI